MQKKHVQARFRNSSSGFTLIELLVVCAVILILLSFASLNLFNLPTSSSIDGTTDTLVEDLKTQQIKAMVGDTEGRGVPDTYGIYFTPSSYTLFHGSVYNSSDSTNFISALPAGYTESTTLPTTTVVFTAGGGEIANFQPSQNTITIHDTKTGKQKTLILNSYGTITNIQ